MKIKEIEEILNTECLTEINDSDFMVEDFCCTELMSDVLAFTHEGDKTALITALSNAQTIRTAEMVDIKVVIIVRGKFVDEKLVELAHDSGITLLRTKDSLFSAAGKIYSSFKKKF
ncbi:MAG: hypothetical protein ACQESP_00895 [Candidatus Muiribacteriota bacterium]